MVPARVAHGYDAPMPEHIEDPAELAAAAGTDADGGTFVTGARRAEGREQVGAPGTPSATAAPQDEVLPPPDAQAARSDRAQDARRGVHFEEHAEDADEPS
jgi:hypothetical protein